MVVYIHLDARKTIKKGKELNELCKTGVLRVGDELHFKKTYDTLAGIIIKCIFKVCRLFFYKTIS